MIVSDFTTHGRFCREFPRFIQGESALLRVSFDGELRSGVTISSATASVMGSTVVTLSSVTPSTASWVISESTVASGRACSFTASGFTAPDNYTIRLTATLSDGQVLNRYPRWACGYSS